MSWKGLRFFDEDELYWELVSFIGVVYEVNIPDHKYRILTVFQVIKILIVSPRNFLWLHGR